MVIIGGINGRWNSFNSTLMMDEFLQIGCHQTGTRWLTVYRHVDLFISLALQKYYLRTVDMETLS